MGQPQSPPKKAGFVLSLLLKIDGAFTAGLKKQRDVYALNVLLTIPYLHCRLALLYSVGGL